jgi:[NiFe] hydrogenase assembly HybE family chaperone
MNETARIEECARLAEELEAHFRSVHARAMKDVPICNENLAVASTGFRPCGDWALGVVVTPWFMNIVASPLAGAAPVAALPGETQSLVLPCGMVECLAAKLDGFDRLLMCSLFSPMQDFEDQEAALATAKAAFELMLTPPAPPPEPPAAKLDRRAFFRGGFRAPEAIS